MTFSITEVTLLDVDAPHITGSFEAVEGDLAISGDFAASYCVALQGAGCGA